MPNNQQLTSQQYSFGVVYWQLLGLAISTGLLVILTNMQSFAIFPSSPPTSPTPPTSPPLPQPHPLPPTLTQWQDTTNSGDYFSQVAPTQVGYLVWSQFPVKVYIETPQTIDPKQAQAWVNNVLQAVHEWNAYLPLQVVENQKVADITVIRKNPPLQKLPNSNIPRARSAQTTYEFYNNKNILYHKFTILLSPSQTGQYLLAAARHELGHALGIWGHSQLQSDALYFSQVRNPPPISARDVNTLKRVYEQPTSLGWTLRSFRTSPKSKIQNDEEAKHQAKKLVAVLPCCLWRNLVWNRFMYDCDRFE